MVGGDCSHKQWGRSKQHLAAGAYTQNNMCRTRKFHFEPSHGALSPISWAWGSGPSGTHSIRSDGPEIENLLWKPYIPSIFCFMKKIVDSSFFGLCLVNECPFFDNFDHYLFLVKALRAKTESGPKFNLKLIFEQFLWIDAKDLTRNKLWWNLS